MPVAAGLDLTLPIALFGDELGDLSVGDAESNPNRPQLVSNANPDASDALDGRQRTEERIDRRRLRRLPSNRGCASASSCRRHATVDSRGPCAPTSTCRLRRASRWRACVRRRRSLPPSAAPSTAAAAFFGATECARVEAARAHALEHPFAFFGRERLQSLHETATAATLAASGLVSLRSDGTGRLRPYAPASGDFTLGRCARCGRRRRIGPRLRRLASLRRRFRRR